MKERQADSRARLREMKMLSAGDASSLSPVLNLTSGIVSVLFCQSAVAKPSSSNSEVVAQPVAVDFVMFESCSLKSGLASGNMEGTAVCSFIPCVSENEETRQVVNAELVRLTEFQVKKCGMLNYRLGVRPFGRRHVRSKESFCLTPVFLPHYRCWNLNLSDIWCMSQSAHVKDIKFVASSVDNLCSIPEVLSGVLESKVTHDVKLWRLMIESVAFWSKRSDTRTGMRTNDGFFVNTNLATAMSFAHLDTIAVLSQKVSEWGIYPAAEPLIFYCRRLDNSVVAHSHCDVARNTQKVRQDHESLQDHVVILGVYELSEKDKFTIARD